MFYTHPQIHTVCSLGAWGPIYLHAVEGEGIGVEDKTKREAEKRRKQQGIMEKSQRNKQISRLFPSTDETNLLFRWLRVCVFCLTSVLMVCSIFPEKNISFFTAQLFLVWLKLTRVMKTRNYHPLRNKQDSCHVWTRAEPLAGSKQPM